MPFYRVVLGEDESQRGRTVLELLTEAGCDLPAVCGGRGRCGKCLVKLEEGFLSAPEEEERRLLGASRLAAGWRLACRARVTGRAVVAWEGAPGPPAKDLGVSARKPSLAPAVCRRKITLPAPSPKERKGDWERLSFALGLPGPPDPWACWGLRGGIGQNGGELEILLGEGRLYGPAAPGRLLGAFLDLGTTTVVAGLVDLENGGILGLRTAFNAQRAFGADVLSRLGHALAGPGEARALKDRLQIQACAMLAGLLAEADAGPANLADLVAVGNAAMEHLFLGLDVGGLAVLPFAPVHQSGLLVPAAALGLPAHPAARVYFPPNLAGFVGADTVAGIVATDLLARPGPSLLVDLGTNGELVLACGEKILACSTAAGPAFEGAGISCGMPAVAGAVNRVEPGGEGLLCATIGGGPPRGLCGSGLIDAVAALRMLGGIDETGRLRPEGAPALAGCFREGPDGLAVVLAEAEGGEEIRLTQADIRRLQPAKGAVAAGVRLLCRAAGIAPGDLQEVLLAGAFGLHLRPESAVRIGLLPGIPAARVRAVGNTAAEGARLLLLHAPLRREAESLVGKVEVLELAAEPDFQMVFAGEMMFSGRL